MMPRSIIASNNGEFIESKTRPIVISLLQAFVAAEDCGNLVVKTHTMYDKSIHCSILTTIHHGVLILGLLLAAVAAVCVGLAFHLPTACAYAML